MSRVDDIKFIVNIFGEATMRLIPTVQLIFMFLSSATAFASDNPTYNEGLLTIPSVDTSAQVGRYLEATFKQSTSGTWQLLDVKETNRAGGGVSVAPLAKAELIVVNSFPVQVFLKVTTTVGSDCAQLQASQRLSGNQFDVGINLIPLPATMTCSMSVNGTLTKTIPLAVYGLKAGTYSYNINNNGAYYTGISGIGLAGTFNLATDNAIAGDTSH